jgi:cellulose synthase/poly-beta-1,6-N-acetylglucosamine synthase-like glycosyltransferase
MEVLLLFFNLGIIFFLLFPFFSVIFSTLFREKRHFLYQKKNDFACIITAYQNIEMANTLVDSLLKQTYPNFHIYLVADQCKKNDIDITDERMTIIEPNKKLGSKVKSIITAINHFHRNHDAVAIFDPDNLAHPDFLSEINQYFNMGYKAVQGKRMAKNLDTIYAALDAAGEIYYNYILKYVPYKIGASSNIAGSGMAIETSLFLKYLKSDLITSKLDSVILAEDKILQNVLVDLGIQIAFNENAIVYDEKVSSAYQVKNQRKRWLKSYFENIAQALQLTLSGLKDWSKNKILFGIFTLYPPLFLLGLFSVLLAITDFILLQEMLLPIIVAQIIFIGNFILVLFMSKAPLPVWRSLWGVPLFIYSQIGALLGLKDTKNDFLPTKHSHKTNIDTILKREPEKILK